MRRRRLVAVALNEWLQTQRQAEAQPDLALSPFEQIEREVIIVPEGATNSLIISATPRFFDEVIRVVKELDERPPMVLIQVLIAQVQLNDTDQFGVELGLQDSVLFDRSLLTEVSRTQDSNKHQSRPTAFRQRRKTSSAPRARRASTLTTAGSAAGQQCVRVRSTQTRFQRRAGSVRRVCRISPSTALDPTLRIRRFCVFGFERRGERAAASAAGKAAVGSAQPAAAHGAGWTTGVRPGWAGRADGTGRQSKRHSARPTRLSTVRSV